jgi:type IV pilus assembly protein PilM
LKRFSFRAPSLVGLDIQPDGVRLVQLKKNKSTYLLQHMAMRRLPEGVFAEGKIKAWDGLSTVLSELVDTLNLKGASVAISLPVNLVRMQRMSLPSGLSEAEIEAEIDMRMRRDLPGMTEALCMDFQVSAKAHDAQVDVFFAITRQAYVAAYLACLEAVGLKTKIVDVDIYALKRTACFSLQQMPIDSVMHALMHVGKEVAWLILFNTEDILFYQSWDVLEGVDWLGQMETRMQMVLANVLQTDIHQVHLCATEERFNELLPHLTPSRARQIDAPNPFARMHTMQNIDTAMLASEGAHFWVACGLAMREVPAW